ncbi:hypothetical protein [Paraburkholderia xenovorans]
MAESAKRSESFVRTVERTERDADAPHLNSWKSDHRGNLLEDVTVGSVGQQNGERGYLPFFVSPIWCLVSLPIFWGRARSLLVLRRFRFASTVFSNSGLSLERPGIGNAKRVDPLLIGRVYPGG